MPDIDNGEEHCPHNAGPWMDEESIVEFVRTEQTFCRRLSFLLDVVQPTLNGRMTPEDAVLVFAGVADLIHVSRRLMNTMDKLGPSLAFIGQSRAIRTTYGDYCAQHEQAIEIVMAQIRLDAATFKGLRCDGLDVPSLLLEPIQRIARYPLLFRSIHEQTHDENATKAGVVAEQALRAVNELIRSTEQRQQLADLNDSLEWPASLMPVNLTRPCRNNLPRKFLGQANVKGADGTFRLMIFNDLLLFCDAKDGRVKRDPWPIWQTLAVRDAKKPNNAKYFELIMRQESHLMEFMASQHQNEVAHSIGTLDQLVDTINRAAECYVDRSDESYGKKDYDGRTEPIEEARLSIEEVDFSAYVGGGFYYTAELKTVRHRSQTSLKAEWRNGPQLRVVSVREECLKIALWQVRRFEPDVLLHSVVMRLDQPPSEGIKFRIIHHGEG
jgi:hypothetical protein